MCLVACMQLAFQQVLFQLEPRLAVAKARVAHNKQRIDQLESKAVCGVGLWVLLAGAAGLLSS